MVAMAGRILIAAFAQRRWLHALDPQPVVFLGSIEHDEQVFEGIGEALIQRNDDQLKEAHLQTADAF